MKALIDVQDELAVAKGFVVAGFMACEAGMPKGDHHHAACTVLNAAWEKIDAVIEAVETIQKGRP